MSSRGFFVGKVIDDLDAIASQVRQRCALGQTDLNRVLEDFYKELLNLIRGSALRNLNKDRSNEPGLDLGDDTSPRKVAFQITSQADASKINSTLRKITSNQIAIYSEINVLIIGERQKSYALDPKLMKRCNFSTRNIIGTTELCREIMDLPLSELQAVQRRLADEQHRIRIELEPQIGGRFETSILNFIEGPPSVLRSDASLLADHPKAGEFIYREDAEVALNAFIDELQRLPRLTREFFGWLFDNSDAQQGIGAEGREINEDLVSGKCANMPSYLAETRLLMARGFIDLDEEESWRSKVFRIYFPGADRSYLPDAFCAFMKAEGLTAASMFTTMNFSPLGQASQPSKAVTKPPRVRHQGAPRRPKRRSN